MVKVGDALGLVLAQSIIAPVNVPSFRRSAMDGYAVQSIDLARAVARSPVQLELVGEALPNRPFRGTLQPNQTIRITTGAPIPESCDSVVPVEETVLDGNRISLVQPTIAGRHVIRVGEDVATGQQVLSQGRTLRPQDLGLLVSMGIGEIAVYAASKVAIVVTGAELLPSGALPQGYQIVDSNSVVLRANITRDGGIPLATEYLLDDPDRLRQTLLQSNADLILISGGTSVGQEDYAPQVLAETGQLLAHGIGLRPGGPTGIGFLGTKPVFLLPGNPVACLCAYDLFPGVALRRQVGRSTDLPYPSVDLPLLERIVSEPGRVDYVRVKIGAAGVQPLRGSGASNLHSMVDADGFLLVPEESPALEVGQTVRVYRYDRP